MELDVDVGPSLDGLDGLSFLINSPLFSPFFFRGKSKIEEQGRCDLKMSKGDATCTVAGDVLLGILRDEIVGEFFFLVKFYHSHAYQKIVNYRF